MITNCGGYSGYMELDEIGFFVDCLALLVLVVPAATCFTLWRIFITNRARPQRNILGLDLHGSSLEQDLNSSYSSLLSVARTVLIFSFGLLVVELLQYVVTEMSSRAF